MSGTDIGVLTVGGAEEICLLLLVVACDAVIQLLSAIGVVQQVRKGTDDAAFRGSAEIHRIAAKLISSLSHIPFGRSFSFQFAPQ